MRLLRKDGFGICWLFLLGCGGLLLPTCQEERAVPEEPEIRFIYLELTDHLSGEPVDSADIRTEISGLDCLPARAVEKGQYVQPCRGTEADWQKARLSRIDITRDAYLGCLLDPATLAEEPDGKSCGLCNAEAIPFPENIGKESAFSYRFEMRRYVTVYLTFQLKQPPARYDAWIYKPLLYPSCPDSTKGLGSTLYNYLSGNGFTLKTLGTRGRYRLVVVTGEKDTLCDRSVVLDSIPASYTFHAELDCGG